MLIIKIIKIKCFYLPRILEEHRSNYSCLQTPPRQNWLQYVRREYATAISFPCLITLGQSIAHYCTENYSQSQKLVNRKMK